MEKMMIQQVMTAPGEISFREVPVPEAGEGQILIKVHMIGICGSDIHVYHGEHPFTSYPVTQGHEVSGEIAALGTGVEGFAVGQKVTIEPQVFCGHCHPCTHGKYNLCEELKVMGFQTTGTASHYFAVDASKVTPIPENMSYEEGAMIEPLAVAVHAVRRAGDISGMKIAVIGAGPIGNLVAQAAKGMGASQVMISDVSDYRLNLARDCGADFAVNTMEKEFGGAMAEAFGPDLAVLNDHELDLNTTMMYRHEDYIKAIELVNDGKIALKPLMSQVFPFKQYKQAYEYIDNNRETSMKILIDVQKS